MKKIGLCLAYNGTNYGMLLQAFATQYILDNMQCKTEIINYVSGKDKGIKISGGAIYIGIGMILKKLKKNFFINKENYDEIHLSNIKQRKIVSEVFRDKYLHDIIKINGYNNLKKYSKRYYAVLVGSDQLWTPQNAFTNFYTLRFANESVRRISYASSMGVSSYPKYCLKQAADYWEKIDYLSVREEQAKEIINSNSNANPVVVLDPTYLISYEQWLQIIPNEREIKEKYLLCYFLGKDINTQLCVKKYAMLKKLKIVSILSNETVSDDKTFADLVLIGKSPNEFINLIRNAECIMTDSFHGLAFSIINHKQFYVFYRKRKDVKGSRNSRIDNIVKTWGVEDRLIKEPINYIFNDKEIDYEIVSSKVERLRKDSIMFLKNAIK